MPIHVLKKTHNSQKKRMKTYSASIKKHVKTYTASIIINNKKLNDFPLITRARMFTVFNILLEVLGSAIRQKVLDYSKRNTTAPICRWHDGLSTERIPSNLYILKKSKLTSSAKLPDSR